MKNEFTILCYSFLFYSIHECEHELEHEHAQTNSWLHRVVVRWLAYPAPFPIESSGSGSVSESETEAETNINACYRRRF